MLKTFLAVGALALGGCSPDAVTLVPGKTGAVIAEDAPKPTVQAVGALAPGGCSPDAVTLVPGKTEVVIAEDAPKSVQFAAAEMANFLSRAFRTQVPIVNRLDQEKPQIVLGRNEWTRRAGLEPEKLPRDGFSMKAANGKVFIAGVDDPKQDWALLIREGRIAGRPGCVREGERGTLFGVYEFLERFVGCRFYFPGELGEIVPVRSKVEVPCGTFSKSPAFKVRDIYLSGDGPWPRTKSRSEADVVKTLDWLRLRMQTESIPCCHGINGFQLSDRFGKTHPEWFCLMKNPNTGKFGRVSGADDESYGLKGHMCYTNDEVWDQVFDDVKAYFDGKDPAKRGIKRQWNSYESGWGPNLTGNFVDIMAQDGMQECHCEKCQKAYDKSLGITGYASELMWSRSAQLAKRLADAGYPAIVTQMSYSPYRTIPKCDIPSNVWVMVAKMGPWTVSNATLFEDEKKAVKAWADKLGHKVWLWTYPAKHPEFQLGMKGPPDFAPRAWFRFYKETAPWSMGTFAESEGENSLVHYLNYYAFAKLAWDLDTDIDALLKEHYELMYGKAAAVPMQEAFELFESVWTREIAGKVVDTALGPQPQAPSECELWTKVWSPERIAKVRALFDKAASLVTDGSLEARRIELMREVFLMPLEKTSAEKFDAMSVEKALARRKANPPKNLLVNGSFAPDSGGWSKPSGLNGYDTSTFVSPPASFRVENKDGKGWSTCGQKMIGKFKDNTTYRISFFVKLENVRRLTDRGHSCWAINYYDTWHCLPAGDSKTGGFLLGSADWFYYEGTFKTGVRDPKMKSDPCVNWGFNGNIVGTAWVDDIVLEEIPEPAK